MCPVLGDAASSGLGVRPALCPLQPLRPARLWRALRPHAHWTGTPSSPVWAELLSRSWCWWRREQGERPACPGTFLLAAPLHGELLPAARLPSRSLCTDSEWVQGRLLAPVSLMLGPRVPLRDCVPPQQFGLQPPQRTKELKRLKNYQRASR